MNTLVSIVLPVFAIILTGFLARWSGLLNEASSEALNRFAYYIALPPLLFLATARLPLTTLFNVPFITVYLGGILLTLALVLPIGRWWFGHQRLALLSLHAMAGVFANVVYMGVPLFIAAFGPDGTAPAIVAALFANVVLMGGILAVELGEARGTTATIFRDVLLALLRNPVLMAMLLGILASWLDFMPPLPLERFLDMLAAAAGPTALFALGMALYGFPLRGDLTEVGWLVAVKLALHPFCTWLLLLLVPLEPFWAAAAVVLSATPSGALVFVIAQKYGLYVQRSAAVIVISTVLSIVTLAWLLNRYDAVVASP